MSVCRYEQVQRGSCRKGVECYFSHDLGSTTGGLGKASTRLAPTAPSFTPGHVNLIPLDAVLPASPNYERADNRALKLCTFYQRGRCTKGTECPFSHADPLCQQGGTVASQPSTQQDHLSPADEEIKSIILHELRRSFNNLSVIYSQGAEIQKVSLPQDFSTASLRGLPAQISENTVLNLLELFEVEVLKASVKFTSTESGTTALVKVEDPAFASYIYRALTPEVAREVGYPNVKVHVLPTALSSGAATQRVNCRTVSCSWHKATTTVYLRFRDQSTAEKVRYKFNSGLYELGDLRVTGRLQSPPLHSRGRNRVVSTIWNVILSNVPAQVTKMEIERMLSMEGQKPFDLDISEPSYSYSAEHVSRDLRSKLLRIGPLEELIYQLDAPGKRHKGIAVFRDEGDASKACIELDETPLIGTVKLCLELSATAKTKVLTTIYDTLKTDLGELMDKHRKIRFNFWRNTDPAQRFTVIKISGSDAADLGSAKAQLDTLLEGYVANVDGQNIWHAAFAGPSGAQLLKGIEVKTNVLIVRESASSILRLFGPKPLCVDASKALVDLVNSLSSKAQEIVLDPRMLGIAVNGAYSRIQSLLGSNNVSLDISSKPKKIVIHGTEQDSRLALQTLNLWSVKQVLEAEDDCPICRLAYGRPGVGDRQPGHVHAETTP